MSFLAHPWLFASWLPRGVEAARNSPASGRNIPEEFPIVEKGVSELWSSKRTGGLGWLRSNRTSTPTLEPQRGTALLARDAGGYWVLTLRRWHLLLRRTHKWKWVGRSCLCGQSLHDLILVVYACLASKNGKELTLGQKLEFYTN